MTSQTADSVVARIGDDLVGVVTSAVGYELAGFSPGTHLGFPSHHLTVVVALDDGTEIVEHPDGTTAPRRYRTLVAGLHQRPAVIRHPGSSIGIQLSVAPMACRALFGVPAGELADRVVDLDALWSATAAERLHDDVRSAPSWSRRLTVLASALRRRTSAAEGTTASAADHAAWRMLTDPVARPTVAGVADAVGYSRRRLGTRLLHETGVTPSTARALARFDRGRHLLDGGVRIGEAAADAGYADHAHLLRDWRRFAGVTPTGWRGHEEFPSVQDEGYVQR